MLCFIHTPFVKAFIRHALTRKRCEFKDHPNTFGARKAAKLLKFTHVVNTFNKNIQDPLDVVINKTKFTQVKPGGTR